MKHLFANLKTQILQKLSTGSKADFEEVQAELSHTPDLSFSLALQKNPHLHASLNIQEIVPADASATVPLFNLEKGLTISLFSKNIDHYRIALAIASTADSMGYIPYLLDFHAFMTSLSPKSSSNINLLSNAPTLEPNEKTLIDAVAHQLPKELPLITLAFSSFPDSLDAVTKILNIIPGSRPVSLPLLESHHYAIQTYSGFLECCRLNAAKKSDVYYTGHYIGHDITSNINLDCLHRIKRIKEHQPMRFLLSLEDNSIQPELYFAVIKYLLPLIHTKRAALYINVGKCGRLWKKCLSKFHELKSLTVSHPEDLAQTATFALDHTKAVYGIHSFCPIHTAEIICTTNLLLRSTDVLITPPGELAFYPVPKLLIRSADNNEQWHAIHSSEVGDGTLACEDASQLLQMLSFFLEKDGFMQNMCQNIIRNKSIGLYDGAYKAVELALKS